MYALHLSAKLDARITSRQRVLNIRDLLRGVNARRGDGTFGELIPHADAIDVPGYVTARGPIATVEIGAEVKILAKAMIKQIDRVTGDLVKQAAAFRTAGGTPICVGIVGINQADHYVSFEKDREWPTNGTNYKHPAQEAADAENRLIAKAAPAFDELLVLRFRAWNEPPYRFEWVNERQTRIDYGAVLTRITRKYEARF
ncbi:MAG TPA: hypothetical protein VFW75_16345 [Acetobacteraceae bacterium]|nr:hypothetical protein [Acetobacteraceae bacterium]